MPSFHWKGRTAAGTIEGDLTAASKDDVAARLRANGIEAHGIVETGAGGAVDFRPTETMSASTAGHARPRRLRTLVIAAVFAAAGFGVGLMGPVTTWSCERRDDTRVACTIEESDLGLISLRRDQVDGVTGADVQTRVIPARLSSTRRDQQESWVVINGAGGRSIRAVSTNQMRVSDLFGGTTQPMSAVANQIDAFVADPASVRTSAVGIHIVPLLLVAVCFTLALVAVAVAALSFVVTPAGLAKTLNARRATR